MSEDLREVLLDDLLGEGSGYRKELTPVKDPNGTVMITISIGLHQIVELDEREQYIQLMAWLRYYWTDENLKWNSTEYGNITRIHIPAAYIWQPDIVLYSSVDTKGDPFIMPQTNIILNSDGRISWLGPAMLKSSCKVHIAEYPFDVQRCPLKFGCWSYNRLEVDVRPREDVATVSGLLTNEGWEIMDTPAQRHEVMYNFRPDPYSDVTYTIILKRKPMYYLFNLLFPCVLLMVLGILVFCLPPESGEKVTLAITVLLAMSVYQLIIMESIPRSSDEIPVLNQYFSASIVLQALSTIMAVLVMNWHFDGIHGVRATGWVRILVLEKMGKLVCLSWPNDTQTNTSQKVEVFENGDASQLAKYSVNKEGILATLDATLAVTGEPLSPGPMEEILEQIQDFRQASDDAENIESEWKKIALVVDRGFLFIFVVLVAAVTVGIFAKLPSFESA